LLRLNAYSNASYEVILTSEIGNLSCSLSVHPVLDIPSRAMEALLFLKQILPTLII
jgi:hypothetical protein